MAIEVVSKISIGSGNAYKVVLGTTVASGGEEKKHLAEIIIMSDQYGQLAGSEQTALQDFVLGDAISAEFSGG